jgi:hypothetical protein
MSTPGGAPSWLILWAVTHEPGRRSAGDAGAITVEEPRSRQRASMAVANRPRPLRSGASTYPVLNVTRKRGIVDQAPGVPGRDALLPTVS